MEEDAPEGLAGKLDFLEHFALLSDPRQSMKVLYRLDEVLLSTLCAVLRGADGWVSVALFGKQKLAFLRRFLPFANGTPSHDQLGLIFGALDAQAFQTCFIAWTQSLAASITGVVAIDGKAARRSFDRASSKGAIHMVSAWSSTQKLVLGARAADAKSNEITAMPELLSLLAIKGAIVIRAHWGVENSLHWVLDVNFRDDDCRIRKKNAPANFSTIKRATLNALRNGPGNHSIKSKRLIAGWDGLPCHNHRRHVTQIHSIALRYSHMAIASSIL
jgi:predicted transposase YbfD/YdcC